MSGDYDDTLEAMLKRARNGSVLDAKMAIRAIAYVLSSASYL